jgi:prepilin-type N-terminal cleavage/methylation domain-containing protein
MHINKNAFTLIELLVAVLIIGILAAIALPQYNIAVEKSRARAVMPLVRAMYDACLRYRLVNGDYNGIDMDKLDITIKSPVGFSCDLITDDSLTDNPFAMPHCGNNKVDIGMPDNYVTRYNGKIFCDSHQGAYSDKICESIGGIFDWNVGSVVKRYLIP